MSSTPGLPRGRVAFLFLGETLLIPHLWPIAEALAQAAPDVPIDLWVATSMHEDMLARWSRGHPAMRLRRAPGFRALPRVRAGDNVPLPNKLRMLAGLAPRLLGARIAVCAEQTSLWLPTMLPFHPTRFVKTSHGVGSMSARDDRRRRAAHLMLVPSALERETYLARGFDPTRVLATGYVKAAFRERTPARALFPDARAVLLYTPHWQRHRSSWWAWGRQIVEMLAAQDRCNVVLAPHQRLFEKDADAAQVLARVAHLPHVHVDTASFAMVDGTYTALADIYLGDTSSQVIEYLARPRPCVFLNPDRLDWRATDDHGFWDCGEVVDTLDRLLPALAEAPARHPHHIEAQRTLAAAALGDTSGAAPGRCAALILEVLAGAR